MSTIKNKFRSLRIGINLTLIAALAILLMQNLQKVDVSIFFWELHFPLIFLLLATALISGLIVRISMVVKANKKKYS